MIGMYVTLKCIEIANGLARTQVFAPVTKVNPSISKQHVI